MCICQTKCFYLRQHPYLRHILPHFYDFSLLFLEDNRFFMMCFLAPLGFRVRLVDDASLEFPLLSSLPLSVIYISSTKVFITLSILIVHATEISLKLHPCCLAKVSCSSRFTLRACSSSHFVPTSIVGMVRMAAYFDERIDLMVFWALWAVCDDVVE